ncbi:GldG family protein [Rubellicoccus peritrichatus]|uniref:GldG family protein n=1 Tax=Rubellicoccus peritrichatus TaxID=3080537 RepID=A0AAQ3LBB4_9BACT|nr:GldG family protein [Puniceicoccus sp. CR14]WOO42576.1 GldG family protein [Puniceicoccus sp. CR14]
MKSGNQCLSLLVAVSLYVLINFIVGNFRFQWDLTASRQHSISNTTREKLRGLESPVTIRYYASVGENTMPYDLRVYGDKVEYFLDILEQEGRGNIEVIRYDPKPGSDAEETANFDSITSNFNRNQGRFYFGLSVSCLDRKVKIPFLHPDREGLLEYDMLQAIDTVTNQNRKTIGILSALPVMGGEYSNERGEGVFPPWLFIKELQRSYDVASYDKDIGALQTVPPDLLIIMHPVGYGEPVMREVDQYIANGGKVIVMLDPYSGAIEMINPSLQREFMSSDFRKLLNAWGVHYNSVEVVADMNLRSEVDRGFGPETLHTVLDIPQRYIHKEDPITAGINILGFPYAGHFWPAPSMAGRIIPLVSTSKVVSTVKSDELFRISREKNETLLKSFEPDGRRRVIVAKLLGELGSAYPETERNFTAEPDASQVILFADADFVFDPFAGETVQLSESEATLKPYNGNLALFSNAVDHLIGEDVLLAARGKGAVRYPLVGLSDIKLDIEGQYDEQRLIIQKQLQDLEDKLVVISKEEQEKDTNQFIENKKVLNQLLAERDKAEDDLVAIERQIDYALQQVKNRYQWANTLTVPLIVLLVGAIIIYRRNSHSRAR